MGTLKAYVTAALTKAEYKRLGSGYVASVPELPGVWARGATKQACSRRLAEVIEDWVVIGVRSRRRVPELDGLRVQAVGADA